MRRLFYGNFDFEHELHELADPNGWQRSPAIRRLLAERASVWIGLANDGDLIWTPEEISESFWQELAAVGLPRVRGVSDLGTLAADNIELVPWGWSRSAFALAGCPVGWDSVPTASENWSGRSPNLRNAHSLPSDTAVRLGNSRAWSFALEQDLGVALPGAARIERLADFSSTVAQSAHLCDDHPDEHRWVIKANFGMAARERILGRGLALSGSHQHWIQRRLAADGYLFFEPWLTIREEVGLQFSLPQQTIGTPRLEGITPLLCDAQGGYRGSRFSLAETVPEKWQAAIEVALQAAERLQQLGYFGPLGIDAVQYERRNGDVLIRPLQDINTRFTMGRLALGFQQVLSKSEHGVWRHFTANDTIISPSSVASPLRVIQTSPHSVGSKTAQHRSEVLIFANGDQTI